MITSNIINKATDELLKNWSNYFSTVKPSKIYHLIFKKGERELMVFFKDKSSTPFAVGKASRINDSYTSFCSEYDTLYYFHANMENFSKERTARPLFKIELNDHAVIVFTHISGRTIGTILENNAFQDDINANKNLINCVENCWEEIDSISHDNVLLTEEYIDEYFLCRQEYIKLSFGNIEGLVAEFNKLKVVFSKLCCNKIKLGPTHGDFWKDNLIYDGNKVFVIDWEKYNSLGFQIFDIYLFCYTYMFNGEFIDKCCQPAYKLDGIDKLIREMLRKAATTLCLDNDQAAIMFELFMFEMCVQGQLYYGKKTIFDDDWKLKLMDFIDNKDTIFSQCFDYDVK